MPAAKTSVKKPVRPVKVLVGRSERQILLEQLLVDLKGAISDARSGDRTQPSAVAALSKELRAVRAELDGLTVVEVSKADELAAKRSARRSTTADSAPATRRGQPRRGNRSHRTG